MMTNGSTYDYKAEKKRNLFITIAECIACIGINFLLFKIVSALGLPLYLDNVGTILSSVLGGYLPGIFVGFMTNIVNCFTDPSSIYYGILTVLIAASSAFFWQKGWLTPKRPFKLICYVLVLTLIGGGLGTLLPWFLDGLYFDSASFSNVLVQAGIENIYAAQFLGNLLMDLLDKAITVAISLLIVFLIPEKLRALLSFNGWMQRPLTSDEAEKMSHMGTRSVSARTKIMLVLISALMIMGTVATGISYILFSNVAVGQHTKLVEGVSSVAAANIDGDSVDRWLSEGESSEGYAETKQTLENIRGGDDEIRFLYVFKMLDDGCHIIFDLDTPDVAGTHLGEVKPLEKEFLPYKSVLLEGGEAEPVLSNGEYGWLLTVVKPVFDSSGKCVCYAAADVSMENVEAYERNFITGMSSLFFAFFVVIFAVVLWVVEYHIVMPVNSMAKCTDNFAFNTNEELDGSVEKLKALEIVTGDEIENLYHAIVKMSADSVKQLEDIRRKNETISKMQNALIMVLADMVESRDKNTGDHVRKTAAYTKIIMKEMKRKGYYSDRLTDQFIENVGNSAPLHDVGKIKVSDVILNKPGRLTDEEFVIMQSHAAEGGKIIEQMITLVPDSDYLTEAKNLAAYHHEKWNGKGYPEGRTEEEIPLSARIMAVADVFDALVSKRSYKEPFSFEQACDIIRKDAGSHFDPLVADAFLSAKEEAREVAKSFGNLTDTYVEDNHVDDSGKQR